VELCTSYGSSNHHHCRRPCCNKIENGGVPVPALTWIVLSDARVVVVSQVCAVLPVLVEWQSYQTGVLFVSGTADRCASGCVVQCWICNREAVGSNLSRGYFAPRSIQPSIPPGSVNEYQLRLGRQMQAWLIPIADERVGVQVKL